MPGALVIVWWGSNLSILGPDGHRARATCGADEDPAAEIGRLAAAEFPGAESARILYQPDGLALHEIACPPASRRRLRGLLATEFPALNSRATAWAAAPLRPGREECATVLYLDPNSALPRLREELGRRGIHLEGAWPLPALWETEPAPAESARGCLGVAASEGRVLTFCLSPAGDRAIRLHAGPEAAALAAAEIRNALTRFDEADRPRCCLAAEPGPNRDDLREALADCAVEEIPFSDWLAEIRRLIPGDLGDLMPRRFRLHPSPRQCRRAAAAGILLLAAAGWLAERHRREAAAAQQAWVRRQAETLQTQENISAREDLRERIDHLQGTWRAAQAPVLHHYAFLVALARAAASAVAVESVRIAGEDFEIRARTDPQRGPAAESRLRFQRLLFAPGQPWRAGPADEAPMAADGEFIVRGSWVPDPSP